MTIQLKGKPSNLISIISILAISAILLSLPACVVTAERGPSYNPEPYSRPGDLQRLQGLWFITAADNQLGKLEFYRDGRRWGGRIWYDSYQQWEELTDILFDSRTGELRFMRPRLNSQYTGTLSGNQILGTFTYGGSIYNWAGRQEEPVDLRRVEGLWFITAADNQLGKLEFYRDGRRWGGRIWYDSYQQWEELTDILFDSRTGELRFMRPRLNSLYTGTLSRNQIVGTFTYQGTTYSWHARRQ